MGQPQRSSWGGFGGPTPPNTARGCRGARGSTLAPCWLPAPGSAGALAGLTCAARDVVTPRSVQAGKVTGTWLPPPRGPGQPARWPVGACRHGAERGARQPSFQAERQAGCPRRAQRRCPGHAGSCWGCWGASLGPGRHSRVLGMEKFPERPSCTDTSTGCTGIGHADSLTPGTPREGWGHQGMLSWGPAHPGFPSAPRYPSQIITPGGEALGWWCWGEWDSASGEPPSPRCSPAAGWRHGEAAGLPDHPRAEHGHGAARRPPRPPPGPAAGAGGPVEGAGTEVGEVTPPSPVPPETPSLESYGGRLLGPSSCASLCF